MGSKGSKPRKPQHSQHLPKVGTATENERLLQREQKAVLGQMGMRNSSRGVRIAVMVVAAIVIVAVVLELFLVVFR